jgi:hypothetical protein
MRNSGGEGRGGRHRSLFRIDAVGVNRSPCLARLNPELTEDETGRERPSRWMGRLTPFKTRHKRSLRTQKKWLLLAVLCVPLRQMENFQRRTLNFPLFAERGGKRGKVGGRESKLRNPSPGRDEQDGQDGGGGGRTGNGGRRPARARQVRLSAFGLLSDFGLRPSDFGFSLPAAPKNSLETRKACWATMAPP